MTRQRRGSAILTVAVALIVTAGCTASGHGGAAPPAHHSSLVQVPSGPAPTSSTIPSAGGCGQPHKPGRSAQSFQFDGQRRTYQLVVPTSYVASRPVPVVFEFHGYGSDALEQVYYGNFMSLADRDDFLVVAPDGQGAPLHFNLTGQAGLQNDVTMVEALVGHIEQTFCVDTTRIFSTGMSDGGAMTSALACEDARQFAAFAAVAVVAYQAPCAAARPVAIMDFAGTADPIVPFDGGLVRCCGNPDVGRPRDVMADWATHDHCSASPATVQLSSQVQRTSWSHCASGSTVVFYTIVGGGHTWPGAVPVPPLGLTTEQISASATIWAFFQTHPLPA